ncbi:YggS family pyridoxal phosphate-dependent enzyme [Methylophaga sp. OBS4]|uniref:YggS family pyridoxal phosphate-dependent enzyme n=1 Tax=Methylophaga sp. OBS4 TaxID=2991935 RepID=UPI002257E280|nr:YggS family pyridoxal phosphate-dependent enzyme [Methylophaga sp. OBS4]MCX4187941.1 YggS family pyridoxal phosphate-dependent enzyme [Methylophaga sp. OBS4]
MTEIKKNLQTILDTIRQAEKDAGRNQNTVQLLAVSKTWPAETLKQVARQGQRLFGENYLQEAHEKIRALKGLDLEWHFIGPIQSNKTRDIAACFDWAQSVDRLKIARRLNEHRPAELPPLNICIQVNIDNEDSKSGVTEDEVMAFAAAIQPLDRLKLRGLMVIPARHEHDTEQRDAFYRAHQLFEKLQAAYPDIDTLSMGMTGDMQAAISEGSTMVRIGTALFGQRDTNKSE